MSTSRDELLNGSGARRLNISARAADRVSVTLPGAVPEEEFSPAVVRQHTMLSTSARGLVTGSGARDAPRISTPAAGHVRFALPGAVEDEEWSPAVVRQHTMLSTSACGLVTGSGARGARRKLTVSTPAAGHVRFALPGAVEDEEWSPEAHGLMTGSGGRDARRRLTSSSAADRESVVSSGASQHNTTDTMERSPLEQKTKSQKKNKRKKKGKKGKVAAIGSFFQKTWQTMKQVFCVRQNDEDLDPSDPDDPQPGPSDLESCARRDHADLLKPAGSHKPGYCQPGLYTLEETDLQEAADPEHGPLDQERNAQRDQIDCQPGPSGLQSSARKNNRRNSPSGLKPAGCDEPVYCQSGSPTLEIIDFQEAADPEDGPFDQERNAQRDQIDCQPGPSGLQSSARKDNRRNSPSGLEPTGFEEPVYCQSGSPTLEIIDLQESDDPEDDLSDQEQSAESAQPGSSSLGLSDDDDDEDSLSANEYSLGSQSESDEAYLADEDEAVPGPGIAPAPLPANPANLIQAEPFGSRPTPDWSFTSRYAVLRNRLLGSGTTGRIFAAVRSDGQQVAVKCVAKDNYTSQPSPGIRTPVPQEVAMMLELQRNPPLCPHVIRMHEWFEFPDGYIVVYEMLSGPWMRLDQFIKENRDRISERLIRDLFRQLVQAVKYCWEHRVEHLYFCPKDTLVNIETMEIKVSGFGQGDLVPPSSCELNLIDPETDHVPAMLWFPLTALKCTLIFMVNYQEDQDRCLGTLPISDECRQLCYHLAYYCLYDAFDGILKHPWMTNDEWTYTGRPITRDYFED